MVHDHNPSMLLYWTKDEIYRIPFYPSVMSRDPFLAILKYLHFADIENPPTQNREGPDYDRLWNMRQIFDILNSKLSELYHLTEHVALDEVVVKFKGKVVIWQYITKKQEIWHKIYKLCDRSGYTYDMRVYLGKQRNLTSTDNPTTHETTLELVRKFEGVGHKGQLLHLTETSQ
jgi:hypothetical protein